MFGLVTALRVVDGRNGAIYEHETQPMGPLVPRADVSTMIDYVYTELCTDEILARIVKIDRNGIKNLADYLLVRFNEHDTCKSEMNCVNRR